MEKLLTHITTSLCSAKGYATLFKAGVVLIGVALLSMSQIGPFLYEKDLAAHKEKFKLELIVKNPIEKIDCTKPSLYQFECMVAKHEMQTLDSSLALFDTVVRQGFWLGASLILASIVGFLCVPFAKTESQENRQQT